MSPPPTSIKLAVTLTQIPISTDEHLWELDLSSKFNVSTPPWTAHSKPQDWNQHYSGVFGTLWDIGDGKFYTFGGYIHSYEGPPPPGHRIREPYYTQNSSGFYFQLPDPRVFAYDPKTGNWSSELQKDILQLGGAACAQSARNKVGYSLGGLQVIEEYSSSTDFILQFSSQIYGETVSTMLKYDFRAKEFTITNLPDDVGETSGVAWIE